MKSKKVIILPKYREILEIMGENIKLARLRRKLTMVQISERVGISRTTITLIEKGNERVAIGHYFNVLRVLNLHLDFLKLASDDILGRKIQDLDLLSEETPELGVYNNYVDSLVLTNEKRVKKIRQTYLMINGNGEVKIGKSYNPKFRETTLQSKQPCIKLYAVSTSNIEIELHKKYSDKQIRGEWFNLSSDDIFEIVNEYNFIEVKE